MKKVYLVRHGETAANKNCLVPSKDEQLNETGFLQAEALSKRVSLLNVDELITSDFVRAQQTAAPLAAITGLVPKIQPEFGEHRDPISIVQLPMSDERVFGYWNRRDELVESDSHYIHDGSESLSDFFSRIQKAKKILEDSDSSNIFVVAHGFFLQCFISYILTNSSQPQSSWLSVAKTFSLSNTGISYLTFSEDAEKWKVIMVNDHAHFAE